MGAAPFTFLPFYPFTFLPLYFSIKDYGESSLVMFMYKMLMNCGFAFIKSANLRTKMFQNAKKIEKNPPPHSFFFITFAPRKYELSCKRLIYIITYFI